MGLRAVVAASTLGFVLKHDMEGSFGTPKTKIDPKTLKVDGERRKKSPDRLDLSQEVHSTIDDSFLLEEPPNRS